MDQPPHADGHGHSAATPGDIPKAGWWSILKRVYASLNDKDISILAAGVAFFGMLSIFPALAALIAIYGLLADPATVQHEISAIHGIIPGEAQNLIETYLKSLVSTSTSKLGIGLIVSVLVALWSARSGVVSLIEALNIAYEEEEKRGFIRFQATSFALTIAAILFAIVALTLIAVIPPAMQLLPVAKDVKIVGYIVPWPILIVLVAFGLAAAYRFMPSRQEAKWRWVSWGGFGATLVWILASLGFSFYVAKFGNYDKSFGALGAVVVLLTWLYLSAYVVLAGACFNAEMERQTARDTTTGTEQPMGERGAKMADTVADDETQRAASSG
ncbi:MAG TPA: YihY/virulence factor BrkB family protein [Candidatus Binataceae bacterium]|nr:YihY/virulence factor BrkB family protein [Candidatus Binataceae bacterium]